MNSSSATLVLAAHLAVLSSISFGGFPTVLPDVHDLAVAKGWVTAQEFANFFAVSQVMPGPNMILMMSFLGLKVGGIPGAIASALATFGPPCAMYYLSYRLWGRFRDMPWQRIVRADGSLAKGDRQRRLLDAEGVPFRGERVDMRVAWVPPEV